MLQILILYVYHLLINHVGAVTEESEEEFHEQTWFIIVVVVVGLITVTLVILMMVCVVRSVRNNKNHEGKYNGKILVCLMRNVRHHVLHLLFTRRDILVYECSFYSGRY